MATAFLDVVAAIVMNDDHQPFVELADRIWDVIVIGAGPAGGMSALRAARAGHSVLLVEAKRFPRDKVCGGCLNARAWQVLEQHRLSDTLLSAGAVTLDRLRLSCGARAAHWRMPSMFAVSRSLLDQTILDAAVAAGAVFSGSTQAKVIAVDNEQAQVQLRSKSHGEAAVRARIIVAADGLNHSSLSELDWPAGRIDPDSRIGIGASLVADATSYPAGELTMAVGRGGYVGITRVEENLLRIAAAVSPKLIRSCGSPAATVKHLLEFNRLPVPAALMSGDFHGTLPMTRTNPQLAGTRLFLLGDATGYVEPFTGEGMSWALAGAVELSPILSTAVHEWHTELIDQWQQIWTRRVRGHRRTCGSLAWLLRRPRLAAAALVGTGAPWAVRKLMTDISGQSAPALSLES
ncbi:MAG: FAD-dependent monooxygenase [Pirellulales bacterium]